MDTVSGSVIVVKEEIQRDVESNGNNSNEGFKQDFSLKVQETTEVEKSSTQPDSMASSAKRKEQNNDQLESTKAEMGEVREENERLKIYLGKIMKEYQTLQTQFNHIVQQEAASKKKSNITLDHHHRPDSTTDETELISLSLGSFLGPSTTKTNNKDEKNKIPASNNSGKETMINNTNHDHKRVEAESLSLGLDYKYISEPSNKSGATDQAGPTVSNPSAESSFEEQKEETSWPPSKALRPVKRSINSAEQQDEISQVQNPVKKARVCVRARCDTPTMNDGCQWRKYGQKIAKGNPCPRAYYRCTVAPSCPVRKQVQRCADDMSILITTYEGTHNHPLPASATAMASTTSAAASMLLSGSSTSSITRPADSMAHAFNTFDSSKWNNNSNNNKQFYLPNTPAYSSFQSSHPTITLDLTSSQTNDTSSPFLNKFSTPSSSSAPVPNSYHGTLYPSSSLSFGGASADNSNTNNMSWAAYGASTHQQPYHHLKNNNNIMGALGIGGRQISTPLLQNPSAKAYQSYMQHSNISANPSSGTSSTTTQLPDITIAAATKAITTDPTFQSALAAALTSIIGGGGGQGNNNTNILQGEVLQNSKWLTSPGDHQQQVHFSASASAANNAALSKGNVTGCASTFLNKTTSVGSATNSQPAVAGGLMFLSSNSMSFSTSKSASASPGDAREHTS